MKRAALFAIPLALAAIIAPEKGAQAWTPTTITACQTISQPGSYQLGSNLSTTSGNCLVITASFVTVDLAGFTITGPMGLPLSLASTGIIAMPPSGQELEGIAVRNGSISGFGAAVSLSGASSIVEGLRVAGAFSVEISATGIVKNNIVIGAFGTPGIGAGISATGVVTGNDVSGSRVTGMEIGRGSTVIGNTVTGTSLNGIVVSCPSNVTDNTAVNNLQNLVLSGTGCNNTNNVAP